MFAVLAPSCMERNLQHTAHTADGQSYESSERECRPPAVAQHLAAEPRAIDALLPGGASIAARSARSGRRWVIGVKTSTQLPHPTSYVMTALPDYRTATRYLITAQPDYRTATRFLITALPLSVVSCAPDPELLAPPSLRHGTGVRPPPFCVRS